MKLSELSTFLSPVLGVGGGLLAAHRHSAWSPLGIIAAIPVGVICGIGCYRGGMLLAVGKHDRNADLPGWRASALVGIGFLAPSLSAVLSYVVVRLILYVAT